MEYELASGLPGLYMLRALLPRCNQNCDSSGNYSMHNVITPSKQARCYRCPPLGGRRLGQIVAKFLTTLLVLLTSVSVLSPARADSKTTLGVLASTEQQSEAYSLKDWFGFTTKKLLKDDTELYRYIAQVASQNNDAHSALIRFTFVPRFNCTPLIAVMGVIPETADGLARAEVVRAFSEIEVAVDGTEIEFPAMVESEGQLVYSYYNATLERRSTFRILVERGTELILRKPVDGSDSIDIQFSLLGSKRAIQQAVSRCRNHTGEG